MDAGCRSLSFKFSLCPSHTDVYLESVLGLCTMQWYDVTLHDFEGHGVYHRVDKGSRKKGSSLVARPLQPFFQSKISFQKSIFFAAFLN